MFVLLCGSVARPLGVDVSMKIALRQAVCTLHKRVALGFHLTPVQHILLRVWTILCCRSQIVSEQESLARSLPFTLV